MGYQWGHTASPKWPRGDVSVANKSFYCYKVWIKIAYYTVSYSDPLAFSDLTTVRYAIVYNISSTQYNNGSSIFQSPEQKYKHLIYTVRLSNILFMWSLSGKLLKYISRKIKYFCDA